MEQRYITIRIPRFDGYKTLALNTLVLLLSVASMLVDATWPTLGVLDVKASAIVAFISALNMLLRIATDRPAFARAIEPAGNPHPVGANSGMDIEAHNPSTKFPIFPNKQNPYTDNIPEKNSEFPISPNKQNPYRDNISNFPPDDYLRETGLFKNSGHSNPTLSPSNPNNFSGHGLGEPMTPASLDSLDPNWRNNPAYSNYASEFDPQAYGVRFETLGGVQFALIGAAEHVTSLCGCSGCRMRREKTSGNARNDHAKRIKAALGELAKEPRPVDPRKVERIRNRPHLKAVELPKDREDDILPVQTEPGLPSDDGAPPKQ